ncbi:MAG: RiPP maturation radical SAM protein 1, partial [Acidobacteriota bacterium]
MDKKPFVRFAVVPFLPASQPALGISSLISVLHREGFGADASYLNLSYGDEIGWDLYQTVTNRINGAFLPGELIFTKALWGEEAPAFEAYDARIRKWFDAMSERNPTAAKLPLFEWWEHNTPVMRKAIDEAPRFIDLWADELLADSPRIIGFTSTFQQAIAGLALAKEIRRRAPKEEVALIFGGANCEADMGQALAENFDFIDCVVSGEGELILLDVVRRLCGMAEDDDPAPRFVQGKIVKDMDALPLPSFEDFFAASEESSIDRAPYLAVESSRGCWWGVKSHCTFCG